MKALLEMPQRALGRSSQVTLLLLGTSPLGLTGVDLATGAFVRAAVDVSGVGPLDVVETEIRPDHEPDATQPEAVSLGAVARVVDRFDRRAAERWLRPLLHPTNTHLLGFAGPAIPFWELDGSRPSVGLVDAPAEVYAGDDGHPRSRFVWRGLVHDLPVACHRGARFPRAATRVLVALTPPQGGHCYKVVTNLL